MERFSKWLFSALALGSYLLVLMVETNTWSPPGRTGWPEALLLVLAAIATLASLTRQLPMQNVLLAGTIIAVIGTLAHTLGAALAIPFGRHTYSAAAGPTFLNLVAWPIPAIWIVSVLNSRGVARLILRPWRKMRSYGFWLMGFTVGLTVIFDAGLEPFASAVKQYWVWQPDRTGLSWAGTPLTNFFGWLVVTALIMAFVTPVLIDKRARPLHRAPDYHPLAAWLLAMGLFGLASALHQLWLPLTYCVLSSVIVSTFAIRGARW